MSKVRDALKALKNGKMIIVSDDESRENEGDLVMLASKATQEGMTFMIREAGGLICVPADEQRLRDLGIPAMCGDNRDPHGTAFTLSVDHRDSGTGISALARALTARALADPETKPADLRSPGHMFPLSAREGGLSARRGHTEAAVELARLAGERIPAAVICEILNPDGTMARAADLAAFAEKHDLPLVGVGEIAEFSANEARTRVPAGSAPPAGTTAAGKHAAVASADTDNAGRRTLRREAEAELPTRYGKFTVRGYRDGETGAEHLALFFGGIDGSRSELCRVHSECLTGDALGSSRCDCGAQYDAAMRRIAEEGRGLLIYLRQEGRGIGLVNKMKAYALQDAGLDTVDANLALGFPADMRNYRAAAEILADFGISSVRLLTNNPDKVAALTAQNIVVSERISIEAGANPDNRRYLETKRRRMNHYLQGA